MERAGVRVKTCGVSSAANAPLSLCPASNCDAPPYRPHSRSTIHFPSFSLPHAAKTSNAAERPGQNDSRPPAYKPPSVIRPQELHFSSQLGRIRMNQQFEIIDGEYVLFLDHSTPDGIIGHIHHVQRNEQGGQMHVPIGHVAAHLQPGGDEWRPHWSVNLFLTSDVRYEQSSRTTTFVGVPESQAGSDGSFLRRLLALRDSSLPYYRTELPQQVGRALLDAKLCTEPLLVYIHHFTNASFVQFGELRYEDEPDDE